MYSVSVFVLGALFFGTTTYAAPCNMYTSGAAPLVGFGTTYNLFSAAKELTVSADCDATGVTVSVGSGLSSQYAYRLGYEWDGTKWNVIQLTGANQQGEWIPGKGTGRNQSSVCKCSVRIFCWLCLHLGWSNLEMWL